MPRLTFIQTRSNKRAELLARNPVFRALGRKPMQATKQVDLALAARIAFDSAQRGTGNEADRDTLVAFLIGIPVLWTCWLAYKLAEWAVRGWYWIKGVKT